MDTACPAADGVIEPGYVAFSDGLITAVGEGEPPAGLCEDGIIDGRGGILMPGFIDGHTHLGIIEDSLNFEGNDCNDTDDPVSPQLRAIDGVNPFDRCFEDARQAGVTCVAVSPGSADPIGGQICVLKTAGRCVDRMVVKAPAAMKFALGENPKTEHHSREQAPETRMATAALIREALMKAKKYGEAMARAHETTDDPDSEPPDEPEYDIKNESLTAAVGGKIPVHFHAHRTDDIFTALRISKEFGLDPVLIHCTEGHLIAKELAEEGVKAFVGPNICDRAKPELRSLSFDNPRILSEAGVKVALTTDHTVTPIQYLSLCAALAVKSGMDYFEALRAITVNPAEILGIADRVGSIRTGMDADLVLFDGDPLNLMTNVTGVWINGADVSAG